MRINLFYGFPRIACHGIMIALGLTAIVRGQGQNTCEQREREIENYVYEKNMGTLNARKYLAVTRAEQVAVTLSIGDENTRHEKALLDIDVKCFEPSIPTGHPCPKEAAEESIRYEQRIKGIDKADLDSANEYDHDLLLRPGNREAADRAKEQRDKEHEFRVRREQERHELVYRELERGNCSVTMLQGNVEGYGQTAPLEGDAAENSKRPTVIPGGAGKSGRGGLPIRPNIGPDDPRLPERQADYEPAEIDWSPWWNNLANLIGQRFIPRAANYKAGLECQIQYSVTREGTLSAWITSGRGDPFFDRFVVDVMYSLNRHPSLRFPSTRARGQIVNSLRDTVQHTAKFYVTGDLAKGRVEHPRSYDVEYLFFRNGRWEPR